MICSKSNAATEPDLFSCSDDTLASDEETGKLALYPIIAIWVHQDPLVVYLGIDGEVIETTPEHPFYTAEGEWVPAGELKAGDEGRKADGTFGVVRAVVLVAAPQAMYDLTVADAHTFFVGQGQWLVHNCPLPDDGFRWTKEMPQRLKLLRRDGGSGT